MQTQKTFQRRFFEFASGAGVAQVVSFLLMPIVSRLYSPAEMGEYAIYAAACTLMGIVVNLRLDAPVVIASDEGEAIRLVRLGAMSSVVLSVVGFFLLWVTAIVCRINWLTVGFISLVAISACALGISQMLINYLNRHQRYRQLAMRSALDRLAGLSFSIGIALLGLTAIGMPLGQTLGLILTLIFLFTVARIRNVSNSWDGLARTFRANADFPKKNLFSSLLYAGSIYGPSLLFAAFFAKSELGALNLAMRVFDAPIYLLGNTFYVVYYRHISQKTVSEKRRLFWRSIRILIGLVILPFSLVAFKGEWIFGFVFGSQWTQAGAFAFWLAPLNLARLCFLSQGPILLAERRLFRDLVNNIVLFAAQIIGFTVGYMIDKSVERSLAYMCLFGGVAYFIGLRVIYAAIKEPS